MKKKRGMNHNGEKYGAKRSKNFIMFYSSKLQGETHESLSCGRGACRGVVPERGEIWKGNPSEGMLNYKVEEFKRKKKKNRMES